MPGNIIVGDDDGVVVIPQEYAEEVLSCCEKRLRTEDQWKQQVEEGETTIEAVGLQEQIKSLNIKFVKCLHLIVPIN